MYGHLGRGEVGEKCEADHSFEQEINVQNMNTELVAQMFKNYQSNVLFHLEGAFFFLSFPPLRELEVVHRANGGCDTATESLKEPV